MRIKKLFKSMFGLLPLTLTAATPIAITSCSNQTELDVLINKLLAIEDIKKIEIIPNAPTFKYKLILHVEQEIDWTSKNQGKFTQRVEFGFNGYSNVNMVNIDGYDLIDKYFTMPCYRELVTRYNSNLINIEYRYFNQSKPSGEYTPKITSYWKYLTISNAMQDFHHINTILRQVLSGKWVISGGSKGGQTTDTYAMTYPTDADAFVAYVGPKCHLNTTSSTLEDSNDNMMRWVLNSIGDNSSLGADKAEEQRLEIFKFQNYLLTQSAKDYIAEDYYKHYIDNHYIFTDYVTQHHAAIYYCCVMDMAVGVWQSNKDVSKIKEINDIQDATKKLAASKEYFIQNCGPSDFDYNDVAHPYYIQGWKEMGLYNLNPQMFIDKTAAYNTKYPSLNLPTPVFDGIDQADYPTLRYKCALTQDLMDNVQLDTTIKTKLDAWTANCSANVIMIYGEKDPWTAFKWTNITSPNIHVYMNKGNSHNSKISNLDDTAKAECWALLDGWLK